MLHIRQFIDKMAVLESRQSRDLVLNINDARGLRDDISKLLADLHRLNEECSKGKEAEVIQVEIKGGSFK